MAKKRLVAHSMRHTTAVHLLQAGAEVNVIRAWLVGSRSSLAGGRPHTNQAMPTSTNSAIQKRLMSETPGSTTHWTSGRGRQVQSG